jgi:hypothetical protein
MYLGTTISQNGHISYIDPGVMRVWSQSRANCQVSIALVSKLATRGINILPPAFAYPRGDSV